MNYGDLKTQVAQWAHRTDLDDFMDGFVYNVSQRLGRRFGVMPAPLVAPGDSNSLLTTHSGIYLYGSLREYAIWSHNVDATQVYEGLYQNEVAQMNINYRGLDWDACPSPVICPVDDACCVEPEVIEEAA